jgi:hypothetical protein
MTEEDLEIYGYKSNQETSHASLRAKERYGVELSKEDLKTMSEICQLKKCCRDYQKPLGYGKHHIHVQYKDIWWNLIYSDTTGMIVSILDPKHNPKPKD